MAAMMNLNKTAYLGIRAGHHAQRVLASSSHEVVCQKRETSNLTAFKRGRGGRSSFSGIVATVFGSTGLLGKFVVSKLGRSGSQIILPYRGPTTDVDKFRVSGDLGQVLFNPFHLKNEESLYKSMKYSNVVINLIGRDYETKNFSFNEVHVEGAERIARIAKECGVEKFIHFSALNASPNPQEIFLASGSDFLTSKYRGELAVRKVFPEAIIFRPSAIIGPRDRFAFQFTRKYRRYDRTKLPLWQRGEATIKQPVYCGDLSEGVLQAIYNPDVAGKTFEAVGPYRYYLQDLVKYYLAIINRDDIQITDISPLYKLKVKLQEYNPYGPYMTMDKLEVQHVTDNLSGCPTLEDLGVLLTNIEDRAIYELKPYNAVAFYAADLGELTEPPKPERVAFA